MGNPTRGFFVWVNGSDRLKISTNGSTYFSGSVTVPQINIEEPSSARINFKPGTLDSDIQGRNNGLFQTVWGDGQFIFRQNTDVILRLRPNTHEAVFKEQVTAQHMVLTNDLSCSVVSQTALPAFHVRKTNGSVYITVGVISFNDVILNQGNCFSGSTFTAPSAGVYHLHFMCQSVNVPMEMTMKSGSTTIFNRFSGVAQDSGSGAVTVYLIANQTVHLELLSGSFWAGNNDTCINFGGYRVG